MNTKKILESAARCIEAEQVAIKALAGSISHAYVEAVRAMYACEGRILVVGVGKSAIIGQKFVATLNSTGTAAHFMHATDAMHGDLGMLRTTDLVVAISKSGETNELKQILPTIIQTRVPIISITAFSNSSVALASNISLVTPLVPEADPLNLVPTSSTTAQLVLCDALAMSLMEMKGITAQDFARNHPGGSLGKQLTLLVSTIATQNVKPQIGPEARISDIILAMTKGRLGAVAVVSTDQKILGIITDGDIRRMLEHKSDLTTLTAELIMHHAPKQVFAHQLASEALFLVQKHSISQILVVDQVSNTYSGMVHLHDLVKEGIG
jgi:arabinose-5-phosphate isomerase